MMRSLSSAVAGLRTHQTKMDVIGNNIANVNTYGFKASRTTFADVYYQNISGGRSGVTGSVGGTNPTQIGYGSAVATIDVMQDVAGGASTGKPLDVYITGEGFLVTKDQSGQISYSRLGNLSFDEAGNLVDGNGNRIQGFPMNQDGTPQISPNGTITEGQLQGIQVNPEILDKLKSISISITGSITGLMDGDQGVSASSAVPEWINANSLSIPATSVYNGAINLAISGFCTVDEMEAALGIPSGSIKDMQMGELALPTGPPSYSVSVDQNGNVTVTRPKTTDSDAISLTGSYKDGKLVLANKSGKVAMTIDIDKTVVPSLPSTITTADVSTTGSNIYYDSAGNPRVDSNGDVLYVTTTSDSTQSSNPVEYYIDGSGNTMSGVYVRHVATTTNALRQLSLELYQQMSTTDKGGNLIQIPNPPTLFVPPSNLPATVTFDELSFDITGIVPDTGYNDIIGYAAPGESITINIGNIVLAKFRNPSGLDQMGTSYFSESLNSGEATYVMPGLEGTGGLKANYLEVSNVDVSKEFTDMITTQRGFQANSRIISVSDEMLQELVNLKR